MSGKPSVMTAEKIEELKGAFVKGYNNKQACIFCGIPERTFYDYCTKNPYFKELTENLKENPKMRAKDIVNETLDDKKNKDPFFKKEQRDTAKWVLKNTAKEEYGERTEHTGKDGKELEPTKIIIEQPNADKV